MCLLRDFVVLGFLFLLCQAVEKESMEKSKKTVVTYSHPIPIFKFDENTEKGKTKVIVETIKSISPSEYFSANEYLDADIQTNKPKGKVPTATISSNGFETSIKKKSSINLISTRLPSPKKKPNYNYYPSIASSTLKSTPIIKYETATDLSTSTFTNVDPSTTLMPIYQHASPSDAAQTIFGDNKVTGKPDIVDEIKEKSNRRRNISPNNSKKENETESKYFDNKPEESGFNGYHYGVGSLSYENKHSSSQNGMMGASYMRSSSPFYNYHVMLD